MEKDLLFGGTSSEIEILEFRAGGNAYGMSINDVKEILPFNKKPTPVPNSNPFIEGIIKPRDFIIPIVNFKDSLKLKETDEYKNEMLIVSGINNLNIAFHVDSVSGIHRLMSSEVEKPGKKLTTTQKDFVIGILSKEERLIEIIDLRKIIMNINPDVNVG